jgi:hypothetical protein
MFAYQKSQLVVIWDCLGVENVWYIFLPFGIFFSDLVHFAVKCTLFRFGMFYLEKSGNPGPDFLCCMWV